MGWLLRGAPCQPANLSAQNLFAFCLTAFLSAAFIQPQTSRGLLVYSYAPTRFPPDSSGRSYRFDVS